MLLNLNPVMSIIANVPACIASSVRFLNLPPTAVASTHLRRVGRSSRVASFVG
jgi:hypothetical protein